MAQRDSEGAHNEIGYQSIQILRNQTLGIGSYGSVCKAKCDDLVCAAKILHPTLFDPTAQFRTEHNRQHRLPFRRFQQECEYLSALKHPNIVQYLGTFQDPESGLPVLLMELMDESLTHFLETTSQTLSYHTQVNFCHDIAMALSFLHRNGIIHRDLSSNNVLLIGNLRAKVTDFGMAKICTATNRTTHISRSFTMCPGTDAYMPPEAIGDKPMYTEKIDCFSFGVLTVQILVRKFPTPGDRLKTIEIEHPQFPVVEVRVAEVERRQNHISEIQLDHPLLPIALECLKDGDSERPSAHDLCLRLVSLKQEAQYSESATTDTERLPLEQCPESGAEQQTSGHKDLATTKEQELLKQELKQDSHETYHMKKQLEEATKQIKKLEKQIEDIAELKIREEKEPKESQKIQSPIQGPVSMNWEKVKNTPFNMTRGPNAVSDGSMVYIRPAAMETVYAYNPASDTWSELPDCGDTMCSIAIVNQLLTIIGGQNDDGSPSNKVLSLTKNSSSGKWITLFPAMPTARSAPTSVSGDGILMVAGGMNQNEVTSTIEVMNTITFVWSRVVDAPQSFYWGAIKLCGDRVYLLGGWNTKREQITEVFTCLLSELLETYQTQSSTFQAVRTWTRVENLPVQRSTCTQVNGRLLSIGGVDSDNKPIPTVYMYNPTTNTWNHIGDKPTAQCWCIAADLPGNRVVTIGGFGFEVDPDLRDSMNIIANASNSVEIGILLH